MASTLNLATRRRRLRQLLAATPKSGNRAFGAKRTPDHTHQGVDLLMKRGVPQWSPVDGATVTHAGSNYKKGFGGYGRHVVIRQGDDGPWFLFAHLEDVNVEVGDELDFYDVVGTTGDSCFDKKDPSKVCGGVHAHLEISPTTYPQDSEAPRIDPVQWLKDEERRLGTLRADLREPTKREVRRLLTDAVSTLDEEQAGGWTTGLRFVLGSLAALGFVAIIARRTR